MSPIPQVELGEQRLAKQDYARKRDSNEQQSLRDKERREPKKREQAGYDSAHAEKEQEKACWEQELGNHENDPKDQPSPPREGNGFHHILESNVARNSGAFHQRPASVETGP
jgi:hypothetical protein